MSVWSLTPTIDWIIVFGGGSMYKDIAVIELSKYMYVHVNNNLQSLCMSYIILIIVIMSE